MIILQLFGKKSKTSFNFYTCAEETRFPDFIWENLGMLCHFVIFMGLILTLTLKIVWTIQDTMQKVLASIIYDLSACLCQSQGLSGAAKKCKLGYSEILH